MKSWGDMFLKTPEGGGFTPVTVCSFRVRGCERGVVQDAQTRRS